MSRCRVAHLQVGFAGGGHATDVAVVAGGNGGEAVPQGSAPQHHRVLQL